MLCGSFGCTLSTDAVQLGLCRTLGTARGSRAFDIPSSTAGCARSETMSNSPRKLSIHYKTTAISFLMEELVALHVASLTPDADAAGLRKLCADVFRTVTQDGKVFEIIANAVWALANRKASALGLEVAFFAEHLGSFLSSMPEGEQARAQDALNEALSLKVDSELFGRQVLLPDSPRSFEAVCGATQRTIAALSRVQGFGGEAGVAQWLKTMAITGERAHSVKAIPLASYEGALGFLTALHAYGVGISPDDVRSMSAAAAQRDCSDAARSRVDWLAAATAFQVEAAMKASLNEARLMKIPMAAEAAEAVEHELTEEEFEILQAAVNLGRYEQVRRLDSLRQRLETLYPGRDTQIGNALKYWANYHASKGHGGSVATVSTSAGARRRGI